MEISILQITISVLHLANILLQSIGCYIMITLYRNGGESIQRLLIINLSLAEGSMSLISTLIAILRMTLDNKYIPQYINIFRFPGFMMQYLLAMMYITIDRLLGVHPNIRYPLYCTMGRAKRLMFITWLLGMFWGAAWACVCGCCGGMSGGFGALYSQIWGFTWAQFWVR